MKVSEKRVRGLSQTNAKSESDQSLLTKDVAHYDALSILRDRFAGLRCAIRGASIADEADRAGLLQLASDFVDQLNELCVGFANERGVQNR